MPFPFSANKRSTEIAGAEKYGSWARGTKRETPACGVKMASSLFQRARNCLSGAEPGTGRSTWSAGATTAAHLQGAPLVFRGCLEKLPGAEGTLGAVGVG